MTTYLLNREILDKTFCLISPYRLTKFTNVDNNLNGKLTLTSYREISRIN